MDNGADLVRRPASCSAIGYNDSMSHGQNAANGLRLAELMTSLSLAIDLGTGQPMEWVSRCCLLGVRLAETLGMNEAERREVYYLTLLRHLGCTSNSTMDADVFGDELIIAELMTADFGNMPQLMRLMLGVIGKGQPPLQRARTLVRAFYLVPQLAGDVHNGHCEVAAQLSNTLGFDDSIQSALWQIYERWDGRGTPNHLKGEGLLPAIRVIHLAQDAATFYVMGGVDAAVEMARERSGGAYDPDMVEIFCQHAADLLACLDIESMWDSVLAAEPGDPRWLSDEQTDLALQAAADFVDLKVPHTRGHSRAVAKLVETAARQYGLPENEVRALRRAALVHDLGRVGVTANLWIKTGTLTESDWERVRLHPYYTERIFARSARLANVAALAATHHERLDGSGYYRGLSGGQLSPSARLLAAANTYCALIEPRPHRPQHTPEEAMQVLKQKAREGLFDTNAVNAVLSAAGHRVQHVRQSPASDLSERELEVLGLLARGNSNKQIGGKLSITEKTVEHHVTHIYNKIGVSTRAGATLYAMQNHLIADLVS
jgi:HD-GYP domain-containing protein (c-di-GMP phosphodiesterase class II)